MAYEMEYGYGPSAADAGVNERIGFIRRTYGHVFGAILAFVAIEAALFGSGMAEGIVKSMFSIPYAGLVLIAAFLGVSYVASAMARSATSTFAQYMGLSLYVGLEAIIFLPLLYIAELKFPGQMLPMQAGLVTLAIFGGLTLAVMVSGKNFSFLGPVIWAGSIGALVAIVASLIFGFSLGIFFAYAMALLMSLSIVYQTSNIMHEYRTTQHVAAALALFASVATLFWYILQIFMSSRD